MTPIIRLSFWLCFWMALLPRVIAPAHAAVPADVQSACTGDAMRLCPMPALIKCAAHKCADVDHCLRVHRREVSAECLAAIRRWSERR